MKENVHSDRSVISNNDQLVNYVVKEWGHEEWIVNNEYYCGKKLVLNKGFRCSLHYHKLKDETFYVLSGKVLFETEYKGEKKSRVLSPGDVAPVPIAMIHRFTGLENSEIMEFSTHHREDDSYRLEISGRINLNIINE